MKLTDYLYKNVRVIASYHPKHKTVGIVITVNKRMRRLSVADSRTKGLWTAYPNEVEVIP